MSHEVLTVVSLGAGMTYQDAGRKGWRRYGVPLGGAMDDHAAEWANRLLENPGGSPVVELLLQGAEFEVLSDVWVAVTGAGAGASIPQWRPVFLRAGNSLTFQGGPKGLWTYLAVEDGFDAPRVLGGAGFYGRGRLGESLDAGNVLRRCEGRPFRLPAGVAGRTVAWTERRDYGEPPVLGLWRGPQWGEFAPSARETLCQAAWEVSSRSDRVGYRLRGGALTSPARQLVSQPVRVGSIQVPESGEPIVTMRDGPTVGGYPIIGWVDPTDLSRLAQCRPGQEVRFRWKHET